MYAKKHVDLTNVVATSFLATAVTYAYFGQPDPRGLVLFCLFIIASEIFVYSRWRNSTVCKLCGFDPLIYKRSPAAAAAKVREFFVKNSSDPRFHLTRSPLNEIQRLKRKGERKQADLKFMQAKMVAARTSSLTPTKSP